MKTAEKDACSRRVLWLALYEDDDDDDDDKKKGYNEITAALLRSDMGMR